MDTSTYICTSNQWNVTIWTNKKKLPGINNTTLTTILKRLEENNIVKREQYNELPLRVEYSLTAVGRNLENIFFELESWWEVSKNS